MLAKHTLPGTDEQCMPRADEIDAIGTKRYESQSGGEREIQRTMLELLNQMDGFDSMGDVKARRSDLLSCMLSDAACTAGVAGWGQCRYRHACKCVCQRCHLHNSAGLEYGKCYVWC